MKWIPGYEGLYEIDVHGTVWSVERVIVEKTGKKRVHKRKSLTPHLTNCGYHQIVLRKDNKNHNWSIHRAMGFTYLGLKKGMDINHKDGVKTNNCLENLEVCSRSYNLKHAYRTGLTRDLSGAHHPTANAPLEAKTYILNAIACGLSCKQICTIFNLKRTTVYKMMDGTHWWNEDQK